MHRARVRAVQHEANPLFQPLGRKLNGLVVEQVRYVVLLADSDDLAQRRLVVGMIILVRNAQRYAQVVRPDEYRVYPAHRQDVVQVLYRRYALYPDDANAVAVPLFQVLFRRLRREFPSLYHLANHRPLQRTPLRRRDHFLHLLHRLAVRSQDSVRARVQRHGHVVRVRYRNPNNRHDAAERERRYEVRHLRPASRRMFTVHNHVVQPEPGHWAGPARIPAHAQHRAVNYPAGMYSLLQLIAVHGFLLPRLCCTISLS